MDGYNPKPLHLEHNTRLSVAVQPEAPFNETYPQAQDKSFTDPGEHDDFRGQINAIQGTRVDGPGNKEFFTYPFLIPKKNGESHFIISLKPLNQFITGTKFKMTTLK